MNTHTTAYIHTSTCSHSLSLTCWHTLALSHKHPVTSPYSHSHTLTAPHTHTIINTLTSNRHTHILSHIQPLTHTRMHYGLRKLIRHLYTLSTKHTYTGTPRYIFTSTYTCSHTLTNLYSTHMDTHGISKSIYF